jgi:hypothetical protein
MLFVILSYRKIGVIMINTFDDSRIRELKELFPNARECKIREMAQYIWEIIPRIYSEAANDKKYIN